MSSRVAVCARRYYDEVFPPSGTEDAAILDLCSSWISHYPESYKAGRIAGKGARLDSQTVQAEALDLRHILLTVSEQGLRMQARRMGAMNRRYGHLMCTAEALLRVSNVAQD